VNSEHLVEWQLGGWLGLPSWLCWILLAGIAAAGVALAIWFYADTLRTLTWHQRLILVSLRSGFFILLLLCLASPARIERVYDSNHDPRPLAVVVDHSASMTTPDQRSVTRLARAVQVWKTVEPDAIHSFPSLRYFRFSPALANEPDLESAASESPPGTDTPLFDSLNQVLKDSPPGGFGGIVCLTDGLDTTAQTPEELAARALQNHSPLYFAVGQNQQAPQESLLVREMNVPGQALRQSQFTATVLVEAHSLRDRDVPLSLWQDDHPLAQTSVHLHRGTNLFPWSVPVDSGEPGLVHLSCRLGEGTEAETTAAAVRVVDKEPVHILFYQGTLDWSYRFINTALQGDSSFQITGLFNPDLELTQIASSSPGQPTLTAMPDAAAGLQPYQIVVLSNVYADQMTAAQQAALVDYVKGGGGLLMLISDNTMAQTFSGTVLEKMLPVVFESSQKTANDDSALKNFQDTMHSIGGADADRETEFATDAQIDSGLPPMKGFALPANATRSDLSDLFGSAAGGMLQNLPQFVTYARVQGTKAGAEVFANHPDDKNSANQPRSLLVSQRFGQGHVTTLLTDGLWRWKLSLPSTSHDPQVFWQQLFLALYRQESVNGSMRFSQQPYFAALGQNSVFQIGGIQGSDAPVVTVTSPTGATQTVPTQVDTSSNSWTFEVNPTEPGKWRISAVDNRGAQVETLLRVSNASHGDELSGLPPDVDGLRKLAESTEGSLLNDGTPDGWAAAGSPNLTTLVSKRSEPLWDRWPILVLALGFYAAELVWRRRAKLL
jgi:uncharacterized membrane protein